MPQLDPITRLNAALEGRYRVESHLGEGGMATVYLADDLKHERKVALKVLKPELAAVVGAERFLAEIKTTANLQHPHILALFDSGEADGMLFYVMPYVEGESLRERLEREHQLPVDGAVGIATNVAEALDYAHRQGVIHRDIKPANILLQDGKPVVSDFGIALAVSAGGGGRLTETGLSLGTPHYMSPEQATGDVHVAAATDIYALGAVLFEMLSGEPPYTGSTPQAILGKIIAGGSASVTTGRESVPSSVEAAIRKALEKVPADRFGSAAAFATALGDPTFTHGRSEETAHTRSARSRALVGALVVMTVVAAWGWLRSTADPLPTEYLPLVTEPAWWPHPYGGSLHLSPDGTTMAYYTAGSVFALRRFSDPLATPLASLGYGQHMSFSPSAEEVAMRRGLWTGQIVVANVGGGDPRVIARDAGPQTRVHWGRDDWIYYTDQGLGLARLSPAGTAVERLTTPDAGADEKAHFGPRLLPGGRGVLFTMRQRRLDDLEGTELAVLDLGDGSYRGLGVRGLSPSYVSPGFLVYVRPDGVLMAAGFDERSMSMTNQPVEVLSGVRIRGGAEGLAEYEVSDAGDLVYVSQQSDSGGRLVWVSPSGEELSASRDLPGRLSSFGISPSGQRVAVTIHLQMSPNNVFTMPAPDGPLTRLTFGEVLDVNPAFLDDSTLVFSSPRDGNWDLYEKPWDGSRQARKILDREGEVASSSVGADGSVVVFCERTDAENSDVFAFWTQRDSVSAVATTGFYECGANVSPDGDWVAYESDQSGTTEVWVTAITGTDSRFQLSQGGGEEPRWGPDGRQLFFIDGARYLNVIDVERSPSFSWSEARPLFSMEDPAGGRGTPRLYGTYRVAPDGRFVVVRQSPDGPSGHIVYVKNWVAELRRQVPD